MVEIRRKVAEKIVPPPPAQPVPPAATANKTRVTVLQAVQEHRPRVQRTPAVQPH